MEKEAIDVEELKVDESKVIHLREKFLQLMRDEELDEEEIRPVICDEDGDSYSFVRRCLIASNNNEKKAYKLGVEGIRWRSKIKPRQITMDDIHFPNKKIFTHSHHALTMCHTNTKDGSNNNQNPVVYIKMDVYNPRKFSTDEYEKLVAFILETCLKAQQQNPSTKNDEDRKRSRVYLIHDMRNNSKLNIDLPKTAKLAKFVSVYYPESCVGVAIHADFVTQILWNFLSPLLDKQTRDRVSIFGRDNDNYEDFLEHHIGKTMTQLDELSPLPADTLQDYYVAK